MAQLASLADLKNIPVLAYGLRTDFLGETFEGSQYLLAWADEFAKSRPFVIVEKSNNECQKKNKKGHIERLGQIEIGGNERHISLCRKAILKGFLLVRKKKNSLQEFKDENSTYKKNTKEKCQKVEMFFYLILHGFTKFCQKKSN